jgi:large subunit ribosomal protein L29
MNANELRGLGDAELAQKLREGKQELFNLRFQLATGQLDNYKALGEVRRGIARVMTVQRERELAVADETEEDEDS